MHPCIGNALLTMFPLLDCSHQEKLKHLAVAFLISVNELVDWHGHVVEKVLTAADVSRNLAHRIPIRSMMRAEWGQETETTSVSEGRMRPRIQAQTNQISDVLWYRSTDYHQWIESPIDLIQNRKERNVEGSYERTKDLPQGFGFDLAALPRFASCTRRKDMRKILCTKDFDGRLHRQDGFEVHRQLQGYTQESKRLQPTRVHDPCRCR